MPTQSAQKHVYENYIQIKADEYYSRQTHESLCKTKLPVRAPYNEITGETYDVYIPHHCDCWLSEDWDSLTLARKFEALRDLSRNYDLHRPACKSLKKTPIMYRNKPEYLTYGCDCWLSVDMHTDTPTGKPCPVCDKPLFFAPRAPQDTAKQACSDPDCINAHGIISWGLDTRLKSLIDYPTTDQEKEHTMSDLSKAVNLAEAAEQAQRDIDNFLAPFVKQFAELQRDDLQPAGFDWRDAEATRFTHVEGKYFEMTGDEVYEYGEEYTPTLSLPIDFVDDPQAYREKAIRERNERLEKAAARKKRDAEERIERLKSQLAKAEADAQKAQAEQDAIKATANTNAAAKLRDQLDQHKA